MSLTLRSIALATFLCGFFFLVVTYTVAQSKDEKDYIGSWSNGPLGAAPADVRTVVIEAGKQGEHGLEGLEVRIHYDDMSAKHVLYLPAYVANGILFVSGANRGLHFELAGGFWTIEQGNPDGTDEYLDYGGTDRLKRMVTTTGTPGYW